jgi:predicted metal-dependent hydrolase
MEDESLIPAEFWQAVQEFNSQNFYACHDTLEALWMVAMEPQKTFYQGILQVAVALYHLQNANWQGAVMLLGEGINRLLRYQPDYFGVSITTFVARSNHLLKTLQVAGPEKVKDFQVLSPEVVLQIMPVNPPA